MTLSWQACQVLTAAVLEGVVVTTDGDDLYAEPQPSPSLVAALLEHRSEIIAYVSRLEPPKPDPSWRWLGGSWWEDPTSGHLKWCEG